MDCLWHDMWHSFHDVTQFQGRPWIVCGGLFSLWWWQWITWGRFLPERTFHRQISSLELWSVYLWFFFFLVKNTVFITSTARQELSLEVFFACSFLRLLCAVYVILNSSLMCRSNLTEEHQTWILGLWVCLILCNYVLMFLSSDTTGCFGYHFRMLTWRSWVQIPWKFGGGDFQCCPASTQSWECHGSSEKAETPQLSFIHVKDLSDGVALITWPTTRCHSSWAWLTLVVVSMVCWTGR